METLMSFGLFTENVFLSGIITSVKQVLFTGIVHIGTSPSEEMRLGTDVSSTNDGLHINNNNYWYTTEIFSKLVVQTSSFQMIQVVTYQSNQKN